MIKSILACMALMLLLSGCYKKAPVKRHSVEYPSSTYFTARGAGQSEAEARNRAAAEMARIFESRVASDTYSRASSILDAAGNETFMRSIESDIQVSSSVKLTGVRVERTWLNDETGEFNSLAVLEKNQARKNWLSEISAIDSRIVGELGLLDSTGSRYVKFVTLKKVLKLWTDREVLVSRVRVLGFDNSVPTAYDIKRVFNDIPRVKASMRVFIEIRGAYAKEVRGGIAKSLNAAGIALMGDRDGADLVVTGEVAVKPVELNNPGWEFARASIALKMLDTATASELGKISEHSRAAHLTYDEALHKAVGKTLKVVSRDLAAYFE